MTALRTAIFASLFLLAAVVGFGARKDGYSHVQHTISELGETGAIDAAFVGIGVFLTVGLALLGVAWQMRRRSPSTALLAGCIATGYIVATFFPCDAGAPLEGSSRQTVHNLGGAIEYIGGAFALWRMSRSLGRIFLPAACVVAAATIALSTPSLADVRGLVQRFAEATLFGSLCLAVYRERRR